MPLETLEAEKLRSLLRQFQGRKILVVGDLIVSRFVEVSARKLAREAPVPAGDYLGETILPGGAANLARELVSLGASVNVVGLVGSDEDGTWLKSEFARSGIGHAGVTTDASRPTSLRTWMMVNGFHTLRIDREDRRDVPGSISTKLLSAAVSMIKDVDCVILSDYDRGAVTSSLINGVVDEAKSSGRIVVGQPKLDHYIDFEGVTFIKSNIEEASHAIGMSIVNETSLRNMGVNLMSRLECKGLLLTMGDKGIALFDRENFKQFQPLGGNKNLFSKVGVRDAMTGVFALGVASGGNAYEASVLSNLAGQIRSDLQRNASLSVHDLETRTSDIGDFMRRIVQAPVRR
jgi:D-beta-D-heptose 7-phosphate kinase/D-beta-D-heptose 1-phosphate adenosyltransferase